MIDETASLKTRTYNRSIMKTEQINTGSKWLTEIWAFFIHPTQNLPPAMHSRSSINNLCSTVFTSNQGNKKYVQYKIEGVIAQYISIFSVISSIRAIKLHLLKVHIHVLQVSYVSIHYTTPAGCRVPINQDFMLIYLSYVRPFWFT